MNRPTWDNFIAVNAGDKQNAFEALARMLFKAKYDLKDNLTYFKNHAGNETNTITVNGSIVGFQAKYFEGSINKSEIIKSMTKAKANNPGQTDYIIYTNSAFGNPKNGSAITDSQKAIEDEAKNLELNIEWWFGDNILDAAAKDSLISDLFFNPEINIRDIHTHVRQTNEIYFSQIEASLKTSKGEFHFDRDVIDSALVQNIKPGNSVMLVGESGSGKSAILKNYYEKVKDDGNLAFYIVNAAQLDTNIVNDIFNLHVAYTIVNFTRFYEHCKTKVMVIDSAEKLLLNANKLAVTLLVNELSDKGWTFIFTCRQNSQAELDRYLKSKLSISAQSINVPQISKDELSKFVGSYDITLPHNERLLGRLTNLFYLTRYVELNITDPTRLTLQTFRDEVWNQKVRGGEFGARGQYREDAMLAIIEDQVTNNRYFTPKQGLNHEAAYNLVSDDVLSDNGVRGYSAKHDIYAEWAMDYIIERKYEEANRDIPTLIKSVGETLAMVNSFARWFEAKIEESDTKIFVSVVDCLLNGSLANRWHQAIIKCICGSQVAAQPFFNNYKDDLVANDFAWLDKFISVMSVSCQTIEGYITLEGVTYPRMKPVGGGWEAAINTIYDCVDAYYMKHLKYVFAVLDNYLRLKPKDPIVSKKATMLSIRVFDEIAEVRKTDGYFSFKEPEPWCQLVCEYSVYSTDEIKQRLESVIENKWYEHNDPYYELTKYIATTEYKFHLLGMMVTNLDMLIALLEDLWLYQKPIDEEESRFGISHRYKEGEWHFGLNEHFLSFSTYMPVSALQTPVLMMLQTEDALKIKSNKVLDFIIRIVNKTAATYKSRPYDNDHVQMATVGLPNGGTKTVISSQCLWSMYRGSSGLSMPYLLQSMHMALEKYLLDLMAEKGNNNTEEVRSYLHQILEKSESCSLIAIVASIVTAYPDEFFEESLLLMQDIQFLEMDMMRSNREISIGHLDFAYNDHKAMWQERKNSRELHHRKIQLENLLTNYQVIYDGMKSDETAKERLKRLYDIVDALKAQVDTMPKDEQGLLGFTIARIDYRNMKHEPVKLNNGVEAIQITPTLTKEQQEDSERVMKQSQEMTKGISLRFWVENKYKGVDDKCANMLYEDNVKAVFDEIKDIKDQLSKYPKGLTLLVGDEFLPGMACALLLQQYKDDLTLEQLKICHDEIVDALSSEGFLMSSPLSGFDICLDAIPVLISLYPEEKETWAQLILMYASKRHETGNYRACDKVKAMISKSKLWEAEFDFMRDIVVSYLAFANNEEHNLSEIDVADTLFSLIPSGTRNEQIRELANTCIPVLADLWKDDEHTYSDDKFYLGYQIADYILKACDEDIQHLAKPFVQYLRPDEQYGTLLNAFLITCCEHNLYDSFWKVWDIFYEAMKKPISSRYSAPELSSYLLNPNFLRKLDDSWFHFEKKDVAFYAKVASDIGDHPVVLYSIVKAFTTIAKSYYAESIPIVHSIVERPNLQLDEFGKLILHHLSIIMQRVFTDIPERLKEDNNFRMQMINILTFMEKNGSQEASQYLSSYF